MATQKAACSDQSQGEPMAKRAKPVRVTETSTTVQSAMACSEEHKIVQLPIIEVTISKYINTLVIEGTLNSFKLINLWPSN